MTCNKCGNTIGTDITNCPSCGAPVQPPQTEPSSRDHLTYGVSMIVIGVVIFIVCCIIQAACGSSMFSARYYSSGFFHDLIVQLTWYPGWIATLIFVVIGILALFLTPRAPHPPHNAMPQTMQNATLKTCEKCNHQYQPDISSCPRCGHHPTATSMNASNNAMNPREAAMGKQGIKVCASCKRPAGSGQFCTNCGSDSFQEVDA